jgi:hypothetical protein
MRKAISGTSPVKPKMEVKSIRLVFLFNPLRIKKSTKGANAMARIPPNIMAIRNGNKI